MSAAPSPPEDRGRSHRRVAWLLGFAAIGMVGFAYALVPIYEVFCEYTGLNTRSGVISEQEASALRGTGRRVLLELDSNLNDGLPWRFRPERQKLWLRLGEINEFVYEVQNLSGEPLTGRALPSVTPSQAAPYVKKLQCFCFSPVDLQPGEHKRLAVRMAVSPELPERFGELTLSYTFYPSEPTAVSATRSSGASGKGES